MAPSTGNKQWLTRLCPDPSNDWDTCCLGFFCAPCLYGRTQYRLQQKFNGRSATNLKNFEVVNQDCMAFCATQMCLCFGCLCILGQQLQIKNIYDITTNIAEDCIEAILCSRCALIKHDREVVARERLAEREREKREGIQNQPSRRESMSYPLRRMNEKGNEAGPSHRPSLTPDPVKNKQFPMLARALAEFQGLRGDPMPLQDETFESQLVRGDSGASVRGMKSTASTVEKPKPTVSRGDSGASTKKSSVYKLTPLPQAMDRDAIIATRQPWRVQHAFNAAQHTLAECPGHDDIETEQHQRTSMYNGSAELSDPASVKKNKGKGVDRGSGSEDSASSANSERRRRHSDSTDATKSRRTKGESGMSEAVLVYFKDEETPQRHRVTSCTRTRASTVGRHEGLVYTHNLSDCLSEETGSGASRRSEGLLQHEEPAKHVKQESENISPEAQRVENRRAEESQFSGDSARSAREMNVHLRGQPSLESVNSTAGAVFPGGAGAGGTGTAGFSGPIDPSMIPILNRRHADYQFNMHLQNVTIAGVNHQSMMQNQQQQQHPQQQQ